MKVPFLPHPSVHQLINMAFSEDIPSGDVTSESIFQNDEKGKGILLAKSSLIICGLPLIPMLIDKIDSDIIFIPCKTDGDKVSKGEEIGSLEGNAISLLIIERTMLNFIQHLSGIATKVNNLLNIPGRKAKIVDTRKTLPGWRYLQKYAVRCGGGLNHRFDLSSGVLIKDNHIDIAGSIKEAILRAKNKAPHPLKIEIEVRNSKEADEAVESGADILLLDNMSVSEMDAIIDKNRGKAIFEASGGINEKNLQEVLKSQVDVISMGMLTHSVTAADISMKIKLKA